MGLNSFRVEWGLSFLHKFLTKLGAGIPSLISSGLDS